MVLDHIQRGLLPGAGIGSSEQDGALVVAAVDLGQTLGLALGSNLPSAQASAYRYTPLSGISCPPRVFST